MNVSQSLSSLSQTRTGKRKRISSYDRSGGKEICHIKGAGAITHIWMTMASDEPPEKAYLPRKIVLRMYWDNETEPSVEAPIGDFFGMGHGLTRNYTSAALIAANFACLYFIFRI